jgi:hypothetical protein
MRLKLQERREKELLLKEQVKLEHEELQTKVKETIIKEKTKEKINKKINEKVNRKVNEEVEKRMKSYIEEQENIK